MSSIHEILGSQHHFLAEISVLRHHRARSFSCCWNSWTLAGKAQETSDLQAQVLAQAGACQDQP
jgi:hypothetical protein